MENLFENEYKMETKYFKEYVYNVLCKKISIIGFIIALIGIIFFCFTSNQYSYIVLLASIIAFFTAILTPIITVKQLEKAEKILNNGTIEKTNIKFSNNIVMNEGKVHLEFEYSQITKIVYTKNFIVLKTSQQSAILVYRNGFLIGDETGFLKFIKERRNK